MQLVLQVSSAYALTGLPTPQGPTYVILAVRRVMRGDGEGLGWVWHNCNCAPLTVLQPLLLLLINLLLLLLLLILLLLSCVTTLFWTHMLYSTGCQWLMC